MDARGRIVSLRRHLGGWLTTVLVVGEGETTYAWTAQEPAKRGQQTLRTGRPAATIEEAQSHANAWLASQGHSCVDLECRPWAEADGTERADARHLMWIACSACEQYFPLDELRWLVSAKPSRVETGRWWRDRMYESDPRNPDALAHCGPCASDAMKQKDEWGRWR